MVELPTGTVTFLFTDLEGSTRLWEEHPDAMQPALARHDAILRDAIAAHGGHVVKMTGDGAHAAFARAITAVRAARDAQLALTREAWDATGPLRVRIGIHTGPAEQRDGDYFGTALNRAARLMSVANGGQVVVSLTTEELLRDDMPEGCTLVDLGEHRLRDLARAEHVFQLCSDGLGSEFAPLRSLDTYAGNLPAQLTSFLGREDELAATVDGLRVSRMVTLTGVGGVGKTRLALQVAAEMLPELPDGAWFCELATATDGEALVQIVAATLGVPPRAGTSLEGSILDFLRSKCALVILDNCEHLLDAAALLAERVLQSCPEASVLSTSREGLAVAGEQVRPLRSLGVPDAEQLFSERARAVAPGFAVTPTNAAAVSEICRRLDGIPLAIELAAARAEVMSPVEIAQLLDERFRLLTGGRRTAVERHQTLRATVDWSYSLLDERDRTVFERLAVFAGSFDGSAATAVVAGDGIEAWDVRESLASLVRRSMVVSEQNDDGLTRYSMLETLRQYARERLDESDDADAWRRRHAEHYADRARQLGAALVGPDELDERRRLREDLDNLRAAFSWALDRDARDDSELAIAIVAELGNQATQSIASGIGMWAERAASRAQSSAPGRRHAVLGAAAWTVIQILGDPRRGGAIARDALRDGLPADSPAPTLGHLAVAQSAGYLGNWERAVAVLDEYEREMAAIPDNGTHRSLLLSSRATMLMTSGNTARASTEADAALRIAREVRNPSALALALFASGWAAWEDQPEVALAALEESISLSRAGAIDGALGTALAVTARIRARRGDRLGACQALREAIEYAHGVGDHANLAFVLAEIVDVADDDPEFAARLLGALREGPFSAWLMQTGGDELGRRDAAVARVRAALDPSIFDRAYDAGAAMPYDEVVDFALAKLDEWHAEAGGD